MINHDEPRTPLRIHRGARVRRRDSSRRCQYGGAGQARLTLVVTPQRPPRWLAMHPALPSTLVFAAFSITALAVASAIDAASVLARTALTVGAQVRAARFR